MSNKVPPSEIKGTYEYFKNHIHSAFFMELTDLPEEFQDELIEGYDISDKENIVLSVWTGTVNSCIGIIESRSYIMGSLSTTQTQNAPTMFLFYLGISHAKPETIESVVKYLQQKIRKGG